MQSPRCRPCKWWLMPFYYISLRCFLRWAPNTPWTGILYQIIRFVFTILLSELRPICHLHHSLWGEVLFVSHDHESCFLSGELAGLIKPVLYVLEGVKTIYNDHMMICYTSWHHIPKWPQDCLESNSSSPIDSALARLCPKFAVSKSLADPRRRPGGISARTLLPLYAYCLSWL